MRKFAGMFILTLVFVAAAQLAFAQQGGGGGRGQGGPGGGAGMMGGGGMMAFMSEEGRKDLGLSEKQVEDIRTTFRDSFQGGGQGQFPGRDATEAEREKFRADMEKRMDETIGKVEKIFTSEQLTKARARAFQAGNGYNGLANNPFAQRALNLTDDQKAKIRTLQREQMQGRAGGQGQGANFRDMSQEEREKFFSDMRTRAEENQKKLADGIKGILTDEQKAQGEKMLSETPDYIKKAIEDRAQRGPGQGGRQGGNGGANYRPGEGSWQPGQGGGQGTETRQRQGGNFPRGNRTSN